MSLLSPSLLVLCLLAAENKPVPKFPIGKETTYVNGPLDKEGYIVYEAALNERLGKGIIPEKNANALLWKPLGPTPEGGKGMPAEFFKRLGIEEPPKDGAYLIGLFAFVRDHLKLDTGDFAAIDDQRVRASQRPWTAKDYPHIAAWLKANEKPQDRGRHQGVKDGVQIVGLRSQVAAGKRPARQASWQDDWRWAHRFADACHPQGAERLRPDRASAAEPEYRFALAGYHRDHGHYPDKLEELAPKYLAAIPDDLFSGKALSYRPREKGYLFYSIGLNGLDERVRSEPPSGDDLPVRFPLPELKQKK